MTGVPDPYEQLREVLVQAAAHAPDRAPRRRSRLRRWLRTHTLLALVVVVGVSGASTAAAVILKPEPSRSIRGAVPSGVSAMPERYRAFVSPQLEYGRVGWCTGVAFTRHGRRAGGAGACQPQPGVKDHRIVEVHFQLTRGDTYRLVVTDDRIAALAEPGGQLIAPVSDPTVPNGWKLASFKPATTFDTGEVGISEMTEDLAVSTDSNVVALDAKGRVLPNAFRDEWTDGGTGVFARRAAPRGGLCSVDLGKTTQDWNEWSMRTLPQPRVQVVGRAFLECGQAIVYATRDSTDGGEPVIEIYTETAVHVLADAANPGHTLPAGLAGAQPVARAPGVYCLPVVSSGATDHPGRVSVAYAKRLGNTWIVLETVHRAKALALLSQITRVP